MWELEEMELTVLERYGTLGGGDVVLDPGEVESN